MVLTTLGIVQLILASVSATANTYRAVKGDLKTMKEIKEDIWKKVAQGVDAQIGSDSLLWRYNTAWLQTSLNTLKVKGTPLKVDNRLGEATLFAVEQYQKSKGGALEVDRMPGFRTCAAILDDLEALKRPNLEE